jgi:hypothetical protein
MCIFVASSKSNAEKSEPVHPVLDDPHVIAFDRVLFVLRDVEQYADFNQGHNQA